MSLRAALLRLMRQEEPMACYPILVSFVAVLAGFGGRAVLAQDGRPTLAIGAPRVESR